MEFKVLKLKNVMLPKLFMYLQLFLMGVINNFLLGITSSKLSEFFIPRNYANTLKHGFSNPERTLIVMFYYKSIFLLGYPQRNFKTDA